MRECGTSGRSGSCDKGRLSVWLAASWKQSELYVLMEKHHISSPCHDTFPHCDLALLPH